MGDGDGGGGLLLQLLEADLRPAAQTHDGGSGRATSYPDGHQPPVAALKQEWISYHGDPF